MRPGRPRWTTCALSEDQQKAEYETQVTCLNELALEAVDRIVEVDPDAIVILQADHGTSFDEWQWDLPFDEWTPQMFAERYSVFNAMRRPEECSTPSIDGQPIVNTFRIVFSCIEDQPVDLLEHRAFIAPLDDVQAIEEIDSGRFPAP